MRILAIETSCERASVALLSGDAVLARELPGSGAQHSANVLPALKALLAEAGSSVNEMDVIAFGAGPGAFTGVRLACSIAQGLALGVDRPVAPVSSLRALAADCSARHIYCAMDARMGEVYSAQYRRDDDGMPVEVLAPEIHPPQALPLPIENGRWYGVGTAFGAYADAMRTRLGEALVQIDAQAVPRAAAVARLAAAAPGAWIDPALAAPLYVRDRVALTVEERLRQGGRA